MLDNYLEDNLVRDSTRVVDFHGRRIVNASASRRPNDYVIKAELGKLNRYTVATLPHEPVMGDIAFVTDGNGPTYLTAIAGGGAVITPVFFDGTNWVAH